MRTDTEMMNLILQMLSPCKWKQWPCPVREPILRHLKDEFQDYDVVYIVENLEDLISDLSWLDQFGNRILIEQELSLDTVVCISCSLKMEIELI